MKWDPQQYLAYADERGRPFADLVCRIGAEQPGAVVDLGCGPGNLTATLAARWPTARVVGIDSSEAMVARAPAGERLEFVVGDLRDWAAGEEAVDVLVSNAALQWVPGHLALLPQLASRVATGGWFAFQVPGNFGQPSHTIRAELAAQPPYAEHVAGVAVPSSHDPADYLAAFDAQEWQVDAWETTYLHVLKGRDAVFEWVRGTGARPTLQALPDDLRGEFVAEFKQRLAQAYPETPHGVLLPFRRIFVVARRIA